METRSLFTIRPAYLAYGNRNELEILESSHLLGSRKCLSMETLNDPTHAKESVLNFSIIPFDKDEIATIRQQEV